LAFGELSTSDKVGDLLLKEVKKKQVVVADLTLSSLIDVLE